MALSRDQILRLTASLKTPFYLYDLDGLRARIEKFKAVLPVGAHGHFAVKANNNLGVLGVIREAGLGADVVSGGELSLALDKAGFAADDIIFSGVGKTTDEINLALKHDIAQINVESVEELKRIARLATESKMKARVALRMNPDVDVNTHPYIRTGFRDNKFGLDFGAIPEILNVLKTAPNVELQGLTLHIGSQIRDVEPFGLAIRKTLDLYRELKASGHKLKTFDVGGGLGIDYLSPDLAADEKTMAAYGQILRDIFEPELKAKRVEQLFLEPGRILVGRFGFLLAEVQYVKRTPYKNFVIVDTGMHHLIRPALYEAHHRIEVLRESQAATEVFDVVGPICESADVLGFERVLPADMNSGDRLVIYDAGAYGAVMASDYNLRERVSEYTTQQGVLKK